jgi:putative glutamine amidotransferase
VTPVVAVLAGRSPEERYSVHRGYIDSLSRVGALPVVLPAGAGIDPVVVAEWILGCDALIVTGGGDVAPELYGGTGVGDLMEVDAERDRVEVEAVRVAMTAGRRVLGICRGAQVLAVATGGSLVTDLPEAGFAGHWMEEEEYQPVHDVKAESGSVCETVLGEVGSVNSIHHQAIDDPGEVLVATAWSPDGVIEAIEGPGALGIQWHPERLVSTDDRHLGPFRWLVER